MTMPARDRDDAVIAEVRRRLRLHEEAFMRLSREGDTEGAHFAAESARLLSTWLSRQAIPPESDSIWE